MPKCLDCAECLLCPHGGCADHDCSDCQNKVVSWLKEELINDK